MADTSRWKLAEVAQMLRVSQRTIRGWIEAGLLRAIDVSSRPGSKRPRLVVDAEALAEFERLRSTGPAPVVKRPRRAAGTTPNYFSRKD